jgi:uncharacterized protein YecE (DUF72 family)
MTADQLPLFSAPESRPSRSQDGERVDAAPIPHDTAELARQLPRNLYLGTSSWFFPGWQGLVWDRAANEATHARYGLDAYSKHPLFKTVCVDRSFYAPLDRAQYAAYARQVPERFRFVVKAPSACTTAWTRAEGGKPVGNPAFLDARVAAESFVEPCCAGLGAKAGVLLFQFSPLGRARVREPARFAAQLHGFLEALPRGPLYAVELRDAALLTRGLFGALNEAGVRYCVTVHPRMPAVAAQAAAMAGFGPGPLLVRWNLNARYDYETAKGRYAPFDRLVDEDESTRESIARLVIAPLAAGHPAFVIANNKAEGSAPLTLTKLAAAIAAARRIER